MHNKDRKMNYITNCASIKTTNIHSQKKQTFSKSKELYKAGKRMCKNVLFPE